MKTWKFNRFVRMLERHGFVLDRQSGNSRIYKGRVGRKARLVSVHFHRGSDDIKADTLASDDRRVWFAEKAVLATVGRSHRAGHGKLMMTAVSIAAREQGPNSITQKPQPHGKRHRVAGV